jgi:hypothetical protein
MAIIQNTLLLDQSEWDLVLDVNGNIALAGVPYSIAQDVASITRTFLGECWYDTTQGLPYWQEILGERPPLNYITQQVEQAALTVPNVVEAKANFTKFENRVLEGQIQVIDTDGETNNVAFEV